MNQEKKLFRISQLLSRFRDQVTILNSNGEFSINIHAENILIKILNLLYNCELVNVNYHENKNYPSIDLRDEKNKKAFQITATSSFEKVKHTLKKYKEMEMYKNFSELYIFIITDKNKSYDQDKINEITEERFVFENKNVIDRGSIYKRLNEINDLDIISKILELLEQQFADENKQDKWDKYCEGLEAYDQYMIEMHKHLDIRGFSPRIDSRQVKIGLENIFIQLNLLQERSQLKDEHEDYFDKDNLQQTKLEEIIEGQSRIIILGDPGSGKTTLLKHLAYIICKNRKLNTSYTDLIPVCVRCVDYSKYYEKYQKSIAEYLVDHLDKKYQILFLNGLVQGNLILLFDGLDEINNIKLRHDIVRQIDSFIAQHTKIKIVATSRTVGYQETRLSGHFAHYEVQDFDKNQIMEFAKNWYLTIAEDSDKDIKNANERAMNLIKSISRNVSVLRLAKNPLLVTIIALIDYQGTSLPEKRSELYQIATYTFLENWVNQRRNARKITFDKRGLIEILSPIAFYMHTNCSNGLIEEESFNKLLTESYKSIFPYVLQKEMQKDIRDIIDFIREDAGFIFEKGRDVNSNPLFGFVHLTFQEYFASIEFATKWKEGIFEKSLSDYIFSSNWHEIILLSASQFRLSDQPRIGRQKASEFISDIYSVDDNFPEMNRPLKLIMNVLLDEVEIMPDLFNNIINRIFDIIKISINEPINKYKSIGNLKYLLGDLLETRVYGKFVLEKILTEIRLSSDYKMINELVDIINISSKIDYVQNSLIEILKGDNVMLKKILFENNTVWPIREITKNEVFKKEIIKYVNSSEFISEYGGIPTQYIYSFVKEESQHFLSEQNKEENDDRTELIREIILALKKIDNLEIRQDLANEVLRSVSFGKSNNLIEYRNTLIEELPEIKTEEIDKYIKRHVKEEAMNLSGEKIATINNACCYKSLQNELIFCDNNFNAIARVKYPINQNKKELVNLFQHDLDEIVKFLNLISPIVLYKKDEFRITSSDDLELYLKYRNKLSYNVKLENEIGILLNFIFALPFNEDIIRTYFEPIIQLRYGFYKETKMDSKNGIFIKRIKESTLELYQKFYIIYLVGERNDYLEYIEPTIELFRNSTDIAIRNKLYELLSKVMAN
jgi:energy-coupling factor transporter ATP-binding protein EcfA2